MDIKQVSQRIYSVAKQYTSNALASSVFVELKNVAAELDIPLLRNEWFSLKQCILDFIAEQNNERWSTWAKRIYTNVLNRIIEEIPTEQLAAIINDNEFLAGLLEQEPAVMDSVWDYWPMESRWSFFRDWIPKNCPHVLQLRLYDLLPDALGLEEDG